jgi:predicted TIM-barrel fold metal-dependent hydrolase
MLPTANRREFLKGSLFAVAAGSGLAAQAAEGSAAPTEATAVRTEQAGAAPFRIVDTHQHLWDLGRFRLPWITRESPLNRNFLMRDYLEATRGLNVVKAVYMEVDVAPDQQAAEADYILGICRRGDTPTVAAVISGRPASDRFAAYLDRFRRQRHLKGVRQVLHTAATPAGYCRAREFVRGVRLLGARGLSFDLCMRSPELPDAAQLIEACPDTRFILDHCGNANVQARDRTQWQRDLERVARFRNVVCKVSGIVASARPGRWTAEDLAPIVNHTLSTFGLERVMFGGDWPVCTLAATYRQWVEALRTIVRERPDADQRRLYHDNAVRFYGLA